MAKKKTGSAEGNNFLIMPEVSKKKKTERGEYLKKRLDELFDLINEWINGTEYFLKNDTFTIDGIKLPVVEIRTEQRKVAVLKAAGLWGFGVNVQVNIISENENNFIFDSADESSKAEWKLIYASGKTPKKLTKAVFRNFLKKLRE